MPQWGFENTAEAQESGRIRKLQVEFVQIKVSPPFSLDYQASSTLICLTNTTYINTSEVKYFQEVLLCV